MPPMQGALVVGGRPERRHDKVLKAIRDELEARRSVVNSDSTIRSIRVEVKMIAGTDDVRAVIINVESERILR